MNNPTPQPQDSNDLRDRLLAQQPMPAQDHLAHYRKEIQTMLDQNEKGLIRERKYVGLLWYFIVLLCVGFFIIGGLKSKEPLGVWFGVCAVFWLLFGAIELIKHFINRSRVEMLREIKKVELEVIELREAIAGKRAA